MVKGSIRIYSERKKDKVANETQLWWLITAGCFYERHQQKNITDKRQQIKYVVIFIYLFVSRILYIDTNFMLLIAHNNFKSILIFLYRVGQK